MLRKIVSMLIVLSTLGIVGVAQLRYVDPGCSMKWENNGCVCNGIHCVCSEKACYERYGTPPGGGEIPLPLDVFVSAECEVWIFWALTCEDEDQKSGYGEVTAEAKCYIWTGADSCSDSDFDSWCSDG